MISGFKTDLPERVWRACSSRTMELFFIGIVSTVVVSIAQPVGLDTDGGGLALHVGARAGDVSAAALLNRFVGSLVVLAVVDAVAHLSLGNTPLMKSWKLSCFAITPTYN
jgi:hypothetical protein